MDLFWPLAAVRWLHLGSLFVLFGSTLFEIYGEPKTHIAASQVRTGQIWLAILALVSSGCWAGLAIVDMSESLRSLGSTATWHAFFWETYFGAIWVFRFAFLVVLLLAVILRAFFPTFLIGAGSITAISATLLVSLAWLGHAAAEHGTARAEGLFALGCHILAAGAWLGGLVPLSAKLRRYNRSAAAESDAMSSGVRLSLERFSNMGIAAVFVIVCSGASQAYLRLNSSADLFATLYGRVLFAKIVLFVILFGVAAMNRYVLLPRLSGYASDPQPVRSLAHTVLTEQVLGGTIVGLAVVLGSLPPSN